ncbi:MAG: hypothetical protein K0R26_1131 [Bacteroidota bacterium]|jgi:hypothetical protein|nr:hypothetical protein [Bacteroidota bacterium]
MKNSTKIILVVLLVLSAIAIYTYQKKGKTSTIDKEASDFRFKDTASIDRIFLADKNGKQVVVEKQSDGWIVNKKYRARPDVIDLLLYTISSVEVKSPVSKNARTSVIKIMAAKSTKVELYSKGEKVKQYYVGHPTQDNTGTYMLLTNPETDENYEEPFITHIPGFDGFLTTRYLTDDVDWRDRLVINYRPPQIKEIKLELFEVPDSSFVIDLISMQRFNLKNGSGKPLPFEEDKLKQYIAYFQNVNCEVVLDEKNHLVDSLSKSAIPFAKLTIIDRNQGVNVCEFFHKHAIASKNEQYGIEYKYDPDKLFIRYNNGKDYGVAQFYVFGKILQTYRYFLPG